MLSNLEKIREAWRIGWAAVVQLEEKCNCAVIVHVENEVSTVVFIDGSVRGMPCILNSENINEYSIVDYRYAAEFAGNEEPKEGQKFLSKKTWLIYEYKGRGIKTDLSTIPWEIVNKYKWQPYFD